MQIVAGDTIVLDSSRLPITLFLSSEDKELLKELINIPNTSAFYISSKSQIPPEVGRKIFKDHQELMKTLGYFPKERT